MTALHIQLQGIMTWIHQLADQPARLVDLLNIREHQVKGRSREHKQCRCKILALKVLVRLILRNIWQHL